MKRLAKAAYHIDGQPMFKVLINELERGGRSIVHFAMVDPNFEGGTYRANAKGD